MQLSLIEREGEALLSALARERYLIAAGLSVEPSFAAIFARFEELCSIETYERLEDEPLDPTRLRVTRELVARGILGAEAAAHDDRLSRFELAAHVQLSSEQLPLRVAMARIWNEEDRDRRNLLDDLMREELAKTERARTERLATVRRVCTDLQLGDPLTLLAEVGGLNLDTLCELARSVLDQTREIYDEALRDQLVHLHLDVGDVWEADLGWVFRGAEYDSAFPRERLLPSMFRTLLQLGIRFEDQSNIHLDLSARDLKIPDPICAALAVPDEIVVSIAPLGGRFDYSSLLRMIGEAEDLAHVDPTQPLIYRRLGDQAVLIAHGLLFQLLLVDPVWMRELVEAEEPRDPVRLAGLAALSDVRRSASLLLYQRILNGAEEPDTVREEYGELMSDGLGVLVHPEGYLRDADEPLAAARRLRAWLLAGQYLRFLRSEFDEQWFSSNRAGRFLADLWRGGRRYQAEDLSRHLGFEALDATPLLEEIHQSIVG